MKIDIQGWKKNTKWILPIVLLVLIVFAVILLRPPKSVVLTVPECCQHPDYPTGCESAALYMLLRYYDVDVTMEQIVETLKKGPVPYEQDGTIYGANPEREFVGDPRDAYSYGVFNEPIRDVAESFKSGAKTATGVKLRDIEKILKNGNPLIAWFTTNLEEGIVYRREWLDYETGELVRWPSYEHAVVITGFDDVYFFYNDPNTGEGMEIDKDSFLIVFDKLGGRIVYYD